MKKFRDLYIDLNDYGIENFIRQITENCIGNWKRNFEREENAKYFSVNEKKYFSFEYIGDGMLPNAELVLFEKEHGILYVSNIVPIKLGSLSIDEYNKLLINFKESLIDPITAVNIKLTEDEIIIENIIGKDAAEALKKFSHSANKSTGLTHPYDEKRWFDFLLAIQKFDKKLSPNILKATLREQGWSEEQANELTSDFEYGRDLLEYFVTNGN